MNIIFSLSLRNLLRQKRRSFLLGIAIGFGMMILVMANSFAHGISDTLLNRLIVYMTGHMEVSVMEKSKAMNRIIRDKDKYIDLINANIQGVKEIRENVSIFARLIGNGKGDNAPIVGVTVDKEFSEYFKAETISGNVDDLLNPGIENPVIIYEDKAKALNVKLNDTIKARLTTISGQQQSARLTIVAILRSNSMFEGMVVYVNLKTLKDLRGFKDHETGALQVNFKKINDPMFAKYQADKLHKLLVPGTAVIHGQIASNGKAEDMNLLGYSDSEESLKLIKDNIKFAAGGLPVLSSDENSSLVPKKLADSLNLRVGSTFKISYKPKFDKTNFEGEFKVSGIYSSDKLKPDNIILMRETEFYKTYLENLPENTEKMAGAFNPDKNDPMFKIFSPEFRLLDRSATAEQLQNKMLKMSQTRWKGTNVDIRTMYESASQILDLESALKLVTLIAVIVLFFIILIGVMNTLRMTIRERTREIGTVRAIGMQKHDVRNSFIIETVLLATFGCVTGIVMAFILMFIIGQIPINTDSMLSILLVNRKLYFLPDVFSIAINFALILGLTAVTAYFPSRRAAKLSAADALRHYE